MKQAASHGKQGENLGVHQEVQEHRCLERKGRRRGRRDGHSGGKVRLLQDEGSCWKNLFPKPRQGWRQEPSKTGLQIANDAGYAEPVAQTCGAATLEGKRIRERGEEERKEAQRALCPNRRL